MGVVSVQSAIGEYISGISILIRIYGFKNLVDIISAAIKEIFYFAGCIFHGKHENGIGMCAKRRVRTNKTRSRVISVESSFRKRCKDFMIFISKVQLKRYIYFAEPTIKKPLHYC